MLAMSTVVYCCYKLFLDGVVDVQQWVMQKRDSWA